MRKEGKERERKQKKGNEGGKIINETNSYSSNLILFQFSYSSKLIPFRFLSFSN